MDKRGLEIDEVLDILKEARKKDLKYEDGRILGSMCTVPHPVSLEVYRLFYETNMGDAALFKGTKELEKESIRMLGALLGNENACGFIVTGGTEANLTALWAAKSIKKSIKEDIKKKSQVIVPQSAHFSFEKAADILGLEIVRARLNSDMTVDVRDIEKKVCKDTLALVGVAGSTEYGTIDDITAISDIALENDLYLHVDAAFGGFVIPFLEDVGYRSRPFDFSIKGVNSITIDPHKMGMAPIPSGGILFRDRSLIEYMKTSSPYLTEKTQYTLSGTRSGAAVASTYAVLKLLGREGYIENLKRCMELTDYLYHEIKGLGFDTINPTMNILVFSHKDHKDVLERLTEKGWIVSSTRRGEIRLVIMPHVTKDRADELLRDLETISWH